MGIFNKSKLKVKTETIDNTISYFIDYNNFKPADVFMLEMLSEISQGNNYLVVIDTKMLSRASENTSDLLNKLITALDKLALKYKVLKIARDNRITIFGASVNINDKKKSMDTIIGTIVDIENIKAIKELLNNYFVYYYCGNNIVCTDEEILDNFERNYHNDSLKDFFTYNIFDSKSLNHLVINAGIEHSEFILSIIKGLNSNN
jgi:hypothetical protein